MNNNGDNDGVANVMLLYQRSINSSIGSVDSTIKDEMNNDNEITIKGIIIITVTTIITTMMIIAVKKILVLNTDNTK